MGGREREKGVGRCFNTWGLTWEEEACQTDVQEISVHRRANRVLMWRVDPFRDQDYIRKRRLNKESNVSGLDGELPRRLWRWVGWRRQVFLLYGSWQRREKARVKAFTGAVWIARPPSLSLSSSRCWPFLPKTGTRKRAELIMRKIALLELQCADWGWLFCL